MARINYFNYSKKKIPRKFINQWFIFLDTNLPKYLLSVSQKKHYKKKINIVFVSENKIKKMNFSFRNKNCVTDILSFEPFDEGFLGDLIICPIVIKKQAKRNNLTFKQELSYIILHGILHLLGFDHEKKSVNEKKMFEIQDLIFLKALNTDLI